MQKINQSLFTASNSSEKFTTSLPAIVSLYLDDTQLKILQKNLPKFVFDNLKKTLQDVHQSQWNLLKHRNPISIFGQKQGKQILKGEGLITNSRNIDLHQYCKNVTNMFGKEDRIINKIDDSHYIIKSTSRMLYKNILYEIHEIYSRYIIEDKQSIIIIESPTDTKVEHEMNSKININETKYSLMFIFKRSEEDEISIQQIVSFASKQKGLHDAILKKYHVEKMICLGYVEDNVIIQIFIGETSMETQFFTQSIIDEDMNTFRSFLSGRQNTQEIPQIKNEHLMIDEEGNQIDVRDHYVVNINDTCDYMDRRYDPSHPAFQNESIHDRLSELDADEIEIFLEFKSQYSNYHFSDNLLIRFLTARGFNDIAATSLLDAQIEWRQQERVNFIEQSDYQDYINMGIFHQIGFDLQGRKIAYAKMSQLQPKQVDTKRFTLYFLAFIENICRQSFGMVDCYLTLVDVEGFGWSNFNMDLVKSMMGSVIKYYPERQYKVYILNVSFITRSIFALMKPLLPQRTLSKLVFVGSNRDEICQALQQNINLENIPMKFGGLNKYKFDNQ